MSSLHAASPIQCCPCGLLMDGTVRFQNVEKSSDGSLLSLVSMALTDLGYSCTSIYLWSHWGFLSLISRWNLHCLVCCAGNQPLEQSEFWSKHGLEQLPPGRNADSWYFPFIWGGKVWAVGCSSGDVLKDTLCQLGGLGGHGASGQGEQGIFISGGAEQPLRGQGRWHTAGSVSGCGYQSDDQHPVYFHSARNA